MEVINDLLEFNHLKIIQNTEMFSFSLDSVLLPNFVTLNSKVKKIMDIGCGNAPISMILTTKTKAHITAVEYQEKVFSMAKRSIEQNHLEDQIEVVHADIKELYQQIESDTYDTIVCNPPYFPVESSEKKNLSEYKKIARHEFTLNVYDVIKISKKLLKNNGNLAIVHRPERLLDILECMRKNNIEPKKIQLIYPKPGMDANILLIEGTKNGKPGLKVLSPLYTHTKDNEYTEEIKKMFKEN